MVKSHQTQERPSGGAAAEECGASSAASSSSSGGGQAPLMVPKVEKPKIVGVMQCLVTPKLTFSVPRDAAWSHAGEVPQAVLREGFLRRFPLTLGGLEHLSFEAVGRKAIDAGGGGSADAGPAVYRLTSSDEAEERILVGILRALEQAYESKHRLAMEQARTDMLSSSMTFQVMADEIRARQEEARLKFDKDTAKLKDNLTTTSKRLFLLEQEKDSLTKAFHSSAETATLLQNTVTKLHTENVCLRDRMAQLESQLDHVLRLTSAQDDRIRASEAEVSRLRVRGPASRAAAPPAVEKPRASSSSQTELVVIAVSERRAAGHAETKGDDPPAS